jgi:hypothetical protein
MADEEILDVFNKQYNNLTNSRNGRLTPKRDSIVRDNNLTELSNVALKHDKPDFITSKKTYKAVVVKVYPKPTSPILGTNLQYLLASVGDVNTDNILQVRAVIPDVHSSIVPMPTNLSPQSFVEDGETQKFVDLAPIFYSVGELNGTVREGSIIEVELENNEYNEGKIISIVKSTSIFQTAIQKAKSAFDEASKGISNLLDNESDTSGDGRQIDNLSDSETGLCGGKGAYKSTNCKTAALEATGQVVTLHPDYWEEINTLLLTIKENENINIFIGESKRSEINQINIRKSRCPQWSGCVTEQQLQSDKWSSIINKCGCQDKTPVAAVSGPYASNHLYGLAVDFKMDIYCPASTVAKAAYENCRKNSKVFNLLKKYSTSNVINLTSEPWHWSYNGG